MYMYKKIVSACSPNNNMYWVNIQYIVKKLLDGLFLVTPYVWRIASIASLIMESLPYNEFSWGTTL